jgi:hypothetical protein
MPGDRPLVIIHGYSDTDKGMRELQDILAQDLQRPIADLNLVDWMSMDDEGTYDDVVTAMDRAWRVKPLPREPRTVDVVVHSTGGLVIRDWLTRNFPPDASPIHHLLMLAPANFGSPLAHKGQSFIGRIVKGWNNKDKIFQVGTHILQGLELASPYSWDLALRDCLGPAAYYAPGRTLCTVLIGNTGYTGIAAAANEKGSDGTVRVSAANLNCAALELDFSQDPLHPTHAIRSPAGQTAFGVLNGETHATIVAKQGGPVNARTRQSFRDALTISDEEFPAWCRQMETMTGNVLSECADIDYRHGCQNTVVLVQDQFGGRVGDYFLEFYADDKDDPADTVANLFHEDAIHNVHAYSLDSAYRSLLIDCTRIEQHLAKTAMPHPLRISLTATPVFRDEGNVGYDTCTDNDIGALRVEAKDIPGLFQPNRTLLVTIKLKREQGENVFRFV